MRFILQVTLTTSNENGANLHPVMQPRCEASSDCVPKIYTKAAQTWAVSYLQAMHHPRRLDFTHLQALCTFL
eukprot:11352404-Ditylum_brightwellii.AAC.1